MLTTLHLAAVLAAVWLAYKLGKRKGQIEGSIGATSMWIEAAHVEAREARRRERRADIALGQRFPNYEEQREAAPWQ